MEQAPRNAVAAAMAVDAVEEAFVTIHILLAHTATAAPLRAVAATAAFDAIEEAIAAIHVLQAHSITVLLVCLQLVVFRLVESNLFV